VCADEDFFSSRIALKPTMDQVRQLTLPPDQAEGSSLLSNIATEGAAVSSMDSFIAQNQLQLITAIAVITITALLFVIISYGKVLRTEQKATEALKQVVSDTQAEAAAPPKPDTLEFPPMTIKKSISFNTVYNLEEFMVRLYKLGFFVKRIKQGGVVKERFISIDQKGNICFHKLAKVSENELPKRSPTPYFRIPIAQLRECFACEDSPEPSLILDFKSKTLHLGVSSLVDRDYIVKGIKLIVQRAKKNASFLIRSSSLLENSPTPSDMRIEEDQYEDDDNMSQTTMNTNYKR
jgi:hypothetical protein